MDKHANSNNTPLPYDKPKLHIIELAAEEVLGVGCKMPGASHLAAGNRPSCGLGVPCISKGS